MPAVLAEIDVAVVVHLLEERLHAGLVIGIRRTDELIVLDAELGPQGLELAADAVHEFLRGLPGRFGGLDDLVAVLVRAGQEPRILAEQRMETAQAVRNDGRIGVPKVRAGVHVINRCRNVKRGGHRESSFHGVPYMPTVNRPVYSRFWLIAPFPAGTGSAARPPLRPNAFGG